MVRLMFAWQMYCIVSAIDPELDYRPGILDVLNMFDIFNMNDANEEMRPD